MMKLLSLVCFYVMSCWSISMALVDIDFETGIVRERLDSALRDGKFIPDSTSDNSILRGPRGPRGKAGLPGQRGDKGPRGAKGERGGIGVQGEPGYPGVAGRRGPQGDQGKRGPRGPEGIQGSCVKENTGLHCDQGPRGSQGSKGYQGITGLKGMKGFQGEKGDIGEQGDDGQRGPPGMPGPPGMVAGPLCRTRYSQWVSMTDFSVGQQSVMCKGMEFLWNVEAEASNDQKIRYKYHCCEFLQA